MKVFIVDGIRTPIGNLKGSLSSIRPDDLAALVIKEIIKRNPKMNPNDIGEVILGCANQAGEDNRNIARMSSLMAGLPTKIAAETVNRLCASGLSACVNAARALRLEEADFMLAGGVESMTRAPMVLSKSDKVFAGDIHLHDTTFGWRFINPLMKEMFGVESMGETAENLVEEFSLSREEQDYFAYRSQQKAHDAQKSGRFKQEIMPIEIPQKKGPSLFFENDEFLKPQTTLDGLAKLKPAFKINGSVTAGNASGLNDGAALLLLASEQGLKKNNMTASIEILSWASVGVEPRVMGIGPVNASLKALKLAGLTLEEMDVIEINEAFAAQVLACLKGLSLSIHDPRINPNGGAIALGHPLGMSGARILNSAALELKNKNKRYALITMCVGVGQGYSVVLKNDEGSKRVSK